MDMLDECRSAESPHHHVHVQPEETNISKDERPTTTRASSSSSSKQACCREQRSDAVNGIKPDEESNDSSPQPTRDKVRNPIHEETLSAYMLESYDNGNNLTDVTVHCESHAFHAHRLVLGHYSEFFRVVFESLTTVSHYDVFLEGFSPREVEVVLLFMYTGGVVCCGNERLDAFIDVAQALHIPSLCAFLVSEMEKPACCSSPSPEVPPHDEDMDKEDGNNASSSSPVWEKCADRQPDECTTTEPVEEVEDDRSPDNNDDDSGSAGQREDDEQERSVGKDGSAAAAAAGRSRKQARPQRHTATPSPDRTPCHSPSSRIGTSTPSPSPSYLDELLPEDDDDDDVDNIEDDIDEDEEEQHEDDVVVAPPPRRANSTTPPRTPPPPPPPREQRDEDDDDRPQNLRHPDAHRHALPLPPPQLMFLRNMMPPAHSPVNPPPPGGGFFSPGHFVVPPHHHHHPPHHHHPHHHPMQQPPAAVQQKQRMMKDKVLWGKILKHQHFHASSRAQHSAPRGGPPRAWSNQDLTEALHNVWNKKMTTSQASRIFGIPYNSLLMYVRGKYGKSLKLDLLKKGLDLALLEKQNKQAIQKLADSSPSPSSGGGANEASSPRKLQPPGHNNNPSPMHKQHVVDWMLMSGGGNSSGPGGGGPQQQQQPPPPPSGVMGKQQQQQQPLHHALFHAHFQGHFDQQRK